MIRKTIASTFSTIKISSLPYKRYFQTGSPALLLDKALRSKKKLIKQVMSEKEVQIKEDITFQAEDSEENESILQGHTAHGFTIPTYETHESLINGTKYKDLPIVHIRSSKNNTLMGCALGEHQMTIPELFHSCGLEGFRNAKKSTTVAAQATGLTLGTRMLRKGYRDIRIRVLGTGAGRLPAIKGLEMSGLNIVSITDATYFGTMGYLKPRKQRRV